MADAKPQRAQAAFRDENTHLKLRVAGLEVEVKALKFGAHRLQDQMDAIKDVARRHGWTRDHDLAQWLEARLGAAVPGGGEQGEQRTTP